MNMRKLMTTAGLAGVLAVGAATARAGDRSGDAFYVNARVVDVQPDVRVVRVSTPDRVCWDEDVEHVVHDRRRGSNAPTVLGTLVGGAIGHNAARGHDRGAATFAGAALGALIGSDIGRQGRVEPRRVVTTERHCEVENHVHEEERITGYRVVYRYAGRTYVTHTDEDPGDTIRLRVHVAPIHYNDAD